MSKYTKSTMRISKIIFYNSATLGSWSFSGRFGEIHDKQAIINDKLIMIHLIN
jgi:hypothetical protein